MNMEGGTDAPQPIQSPRLDIHKLVDEYLNAYGSIVKHPNARLMLRSEQAWVLHKRASHVEAGGRETCIIEGLLP
jgi:hypothetical protein